MISCGRTSERFPLPHGNEMLWSDAEVDSVDTVLLLAVALAAEDAKHWSYLHPTPPAGVGGNQRCRERPRVLAVYRIHELLLITIVLNRYSFFTSFVDLGTPIWGIFIWEGGGGTPLPD
jgi:hypothetical protein